MRQIQYKKGIKWWKAEKKFENFILKNYRTMKFWVNEEDDQTKFR